MLGKVITFLVEGISSDNFPQVQNRENPDYQYLATKERNSISLFPIFFYIFEENEESFEEKF